MKNQISRKILPEDFSFTAEVKADRSGSDLYVEIGSRRYSLNHGRYEGLAAGDRVHIKIKEGKPVVLSGYNGTAGEESLPDFKVRGTLYPFRDRKQTYKKRKQMERDRDHELGFEEDLEQLGI